MFNVVQLEDDIRVEPKDLTKTPLAAVTEVIERRYLDRVIPGTGLVTSLYDVQSIEGGHIYPNDGAAHFKVTFRLTLFAPFAGEVLLGKLVASDPHGLKISLGFFDDVRVPAMFMQEPSSWDEQERVWTWNFEDQLMYMDPGEWVRFKVEYVEFKPAPTPAQMRAAEGEDALRGTTERPWALMEVVGCVNGDGLGCLSWWEPQEGEEEGAAAAAAAEDGGGAHANGRADGGAAAAGGDDDEPMSEGEEG